MVLKSEMFILKKNIPNKIENNRNRITLKVYNDNKAYEEDNIILINY